MSTMNTVVAVYDTHEQAEAAIKDLQEAGVDMQSLSIAGKDTYTDEHVVGYYNAGDRMKYWGKLGAFWGGLWGLLFGSAMFSILGIGPILVAGPLVAWIIGALEGATVVGGVSAIGAGLVSISIPKDSVLKYDVALKTDKFLCWFTVRRTRCPMLKQSLKAPGTAPTPFTTKPYSHKGQNNARKEELRMKPEKGGPRLRSLGSLTLLSLWSGLAFGQMGTRSLSGTVAVLSTSLS